MGNGDLSNVEALIAQGESLRERLRAILGGQPFDPLDLNRDELECPHLMLSPPFDLSANQIGFMNRVRALFADMKMRKISAASTALRRISDVSFVPAAHQLMLITELKSSRAQLEPAPPEPNVVLRIQTVGAYQADMGRVIEALKGVKDALLRGTGKHQKPQSVGRPRDEKIDQAYDLLIQEMDDPKLLEQHPELTTRVKKRAYVIKHKVLPKFTPLGYSEKTLRVGISHREGQKAALRRQKKERKETATQ